ncbi:MAG: hypothetical protein A2Y95_00065 [Deltaproteobacteria bacterium RBG_13_65_10]|nr:MAG: hypothetical protein A2Y95_00065 [Deltaproteobacteria bacterium RBG_13_65_10]
METSPEESRGGETGRSGPGALWRVLFGPKRLWLGTFVLLCLLLAILLLLGENSALAPFVYAVF